MNNLSPILFPLYRFPTPCGAAFQHLQRCAIPVLDGRCLLGKVALGAAEEPGGRARARMAVHHMSWTALPWAVLWDRLMSGRSLLLVQAGRTSFGCLVFHLSLFSLGTTLCRARLTAFLLWSFLQPLADERFQKEVRQGSEKMKGEQQGDSRTHRTLLNCFNHIACRRMGAWG